MLYPDFDELVSLKNKKAQTILPSRSVRSSVPGNHHSPYRGQGLEFDSVREYVPGDDIRNIDWRVTARTGSPHLKLFKQERDRQMVICIDMNAGMRFGTRNTFKSVQAARVAALLGWQGLANHDRVSACLFGDVPGGLQYFSPKRARKSLSSLLKMLAAPPVEHHQVSLENALQHIGKAAHTGSLIYLISDFLEIKSNAQTESGLVRLNKRCDVIFVAINDPADKTISPAGTIAFAGNADRTLLVDTDSTEGKRAYENLWRENRQSLRAAASGAKVPVIELSTESDVHRDLVAGMRMIAKRKKR